MLATGSTASWIDPGGTEWPLTSPALGWFTLNEVTGLGAALVELTTDPDARGGSRVRHAQTKSRTLTWGLHVHGDDHTQFLNRWRSLALAFARTRRDGPGTLVITRPDGSQREAQAWYVQGFDNSPDGHHVADDVVLSLLCEDPFWRDRTATVITRRYAVPTSYLGPYPRVSTSQVLGRTTITNPGSAEAWPDWTITGPATLITATNNTTGETWTLDPDATGVDHGPLLSTEQVTLTTGRPAVRGPAGEIWTAAMNWPAATLWGLAPGVNDVTFTVADAGPGTVISLAFKARYETA